MEWYGSIHNHSEYSNFRLRDSINRIADMVDYAMELGHNFIAITEHETIASALEAQKIERQAREKDPSFKIIRGNEIYLCRNGLNQDNFIKGEDKYFHFILLAKDEIGHKQIREISTRAWLRSYKGRGMVRVPTYYQDLIDIIQSNQGHVIGSSACFRKGTLVLTMNGEKKIEDIKSDDYILNRYGNWEKVNFPTHRIYNGLGKEIRFLGNPTPTICTDNHQFLVTTANKIHSYKENGKNPLEWVEAKNLNTSKGGKKHICVCPVNVSYTNQNIIYKKEWKNSLKKDKYYNKKTINSEIKITPELIRLFGLWLGDGYISIDFNKNYYCVGFTFSDEEFNYYWDSFVKKASEEIGIDWSITKRPEHHRVDLASHSIELVELFYYLFGNNKADTKHIPERLKHISKELDFNLFMGYAFADGYFRIRKTNGYNRGEFTSASVSEKLTKDFQDILRTLGIRSSIAISSEYISKDNVHHKTAYYLSSYNKAWTFINKKSIITNQDIINYMSIATKHDNKKFIKINETLYEKIYIKEIKNIDLNETVYCLNVDSHSFCCNGVIVHNCLGSQLGQFLLKYKETNDKEYFEKAQMWVEKISQIFGKENFFLETQPSNSDEQVFVNQNIKIISENTGFPVVISLDAHYLKKEDINIHKAFLNSQDGDRETESFYATTYIMSREEIHEYMDKYLGADIVSQWMNNTKLIYDMCEDYDLTKPLRIPYLPRTIDKITDEEYNEFKNKITKLSLFYNSKYDSDRHLAAAIVKRIENDRKQYDNEETYKEIDLNLDVIWLSSEKQNTRWSAYLLNMRDYIDVIWNEGDSLVGPSRGSGGGFILLNILGITQINPLREKTKTYFWRFLNPERVSPLDIDTDIEGGKREQVYQAFQKVYGEDRVSKVLTLRTEKSKSALLTAARGLGLTPEEGSYLSSFIVADRGQARTLSQTYYGDKENDIAPNKQFKNLMDGQYSNVWEVAQKIEGLINGVGSHAGGVIFVDEPFTETTALMKTTNGDVVTQFDLHQDEEVGLIKIDLLSIEALDKMRACLNLLIEDNLIEHENKSLRQIYEDTIGVYNLEREEPEMWKLLQEHKVLSLFQMEQMSGIKGIEAVQPESVDDLATLNSVIRLMASEKGAKQPLEVFAEQKQDITIWEQQMIEAGLTEEERQWLHSYLDISYGVCESQEKLMSIIQDEKVGGHSLLFADTLRKAIAKKKPKQFLECEEVFFNTAKEKNLSINLCNYVWNEVFKIQRGYSFCAAHTLAYSIVGLQELNLAYKFPIIYWNTANLIVDSGSMKLKDEFNSNTDDDDEDIDSDEEVEKMKNSTVDYGKISTAIGLTRKAGISVSLPNINKSDITFKPDIENNTILYGLKGISRIGNQLVRDIFSNRPYTSIEDFMDKVKTNKTQMIALIKAGTFDTLYPNNTRKEIMNKYLYTVADTKKKITLQNMSSLIKYNLIPNNLDFEKRLFNFNKYIKKNKNDDYYILDSVALKFYMQYFDNDLLEQVKINGDDGQALIKQKRWDNIYKNRMNPLRDWVKKEQDTILTKINDNIIKEISDKYAIGNISAWEMDALGFYYHNHELAHINKYRYGIENYFNLTDVPEIERSFTDAFGRQIVIYKLHKICGTVIDKDKSKCTLKLLTTDGVVDVKIWKSQFSKFDKQISIVGKDGKKHVIEKSFFTRGTKLLLTGIKRDNTFIPKMYKNSGIISPIQKIDSIDEHGELTLISDRFKEEEE